MKNEVFLNRTAAFLPFDPVSNDDMEAVLGMVGGRPSRARRLVLRSNGIQSRHYAIDRSTGQLAYNNAQLTANAIRALGDVGHVDLLATGTSSPDQMLPSHVVMVHGELGWSTLEVVSLAGVCLSGGAALKHAFLAIKAGESSRAVVTGSELASAQMRAQIYQAEHEYLLQQLEARPELAFEKDFLRWMLSDGAGAFLLEDHPGAGLSLRIDWIDLFSYAHKLPTCMYAGADVDADGNMLGWKQWPSQQWAERSIFAVKQDVRLLNANIMAMGFESLEAVRAKRCLSAESLDWFLPHLSSNYFVPQLQDYFATHDFNIPPTRWFTNLTQRGNTGSASPFIMLDELLRSGRVKSGHKLLMYIPESGRFSSGFVHLTAQ